MESGTGATDRVDETTVDAGETPGDRQPQRPPVGVGVRWCRGPGDHVVNGQHRRPGRVEATDQFTEEPPSGTTGRHNAVVTTTTSTKKAAPSKAAPTPSSRSENPMAPPSPTHPIAAPRPAGVGFAADLIDSIRATDEFDGVHLVPVARYREIAAALLDRG